MTDSAIESLKSIRLVHNLVIVSSVTLGLLGFPQYTTEDPFSKALQELDLIVPAYENIRSAEVALIREFYEKTGSMAVINEIFEGVPIVPTGNFLWDFDNDNLEILDRRLKNMHGSWQFSDMTVFQIDWEPRKAELESWYIWCKRIATQRHSKPERLCLVESGRIKKSPTAQIYDAFGRLGSASLDVTSTKHLARKAISAQNTVWMSGLARVVDGDTITFPLLKTVWDVVKPLTIGEARVALKRHSKELLRKIEGKLSLFGLTIDSRYASVVGPVITISLLLYLLSLLEHARLIQRDDDFRTFPWVGFFNSAVGSVILFSTVLVLPSLSSIAILFASDSSQTSKWILGLFFSVFQLSLGFLIIKQVNQIEGKHAPEPTVHT